MLPPSQDASIASEGLARDDCIREITIYPTASMGLVYFPTFTIKKIN